MNFARPPPLHHTMHITHLAWNIVDTTNSSNYDNIMLKKLLYHHVLWLTSITGVHDRCANKGGESQERYILSQES